MTVTECLARITLASSYGVDTSRADRIEASLAVHSH